MPRKIPSKPKTARSRAKQGKFATEQFEWPAPRVVGIGASAGGLEALTRFLRAVPLKTEMAYVVVQHLERHHESALTKLLARATRLPVLEAREGIRAEPNHVYVIPADADLRLVDGLLKVNARQAPPGHHLPIDSFFRSLAEVQGPRAAGVILSGTGHDGTAGIQAIKEAGGITFAQDLESAKFSGMPASAIDSGAVDFVLPPERIAKELPRAARHRLEGLAPMGAVPQVPAVEEEWNRLFHLLRKGTGVDFSRYTKSTFKRRLARRMAVCKASTLGAYLKILEDNRLELDALFGELLILVTGFFRDRQVFQALRKKVFPKILTGKPEGEPVRIWCAGCSTGQEAYSVAMTLLECLGEKAASTTIQVFATDISEVALEKARAAVYTAAEMKDVPAAIRRRYFTHADGNYQVVQSIRKLCVFSRHDLTRDPPFSRLDLLTCRNVLIYLEPSAQKRVLAAFHYGLRPEGILLLGKSSGASSLGDLFRLSDHKNRIFRKVAGAHAPFTAMQPPPEQIHLEKASKGATAGAELEREADQLVWERYSHAGLVVDNDLQILHFRGDTSPYLRPASGKASLHLMRILREELVLEVRAALQKVRRNERSVRSEGIEFRPNGNASQVNIEVRSMNRGGADKCFLILFERVDGASSAATRRKPAPATKANHSELVRLREELARTREYVQTIVREQEASNEELKTANEEAISSMEELQSTNEELETAKEELQSSNEELITLNEQLQNRNAELAQLSNEHANVLSGTQIPIVILGADRRIRRFTPSAEKTLGLIPADVGRLIGQIRIGIPVKELEQTIALVTQQAREVQREVQLHSGRWFLLRVLPFQTGDGRTEGVLLAFVDIDELRQHREQLRKDKNFVSAVLDAATGLLVVVVDREGRIVHFNQVCQKLTGYSLEEARGRYVWDFLLVPEDVAAAKDTFRKLAAGMPAQVVNHWVSKTGKKLLITWANAALKTDGDGDVEAVIGTGIDVTALEEASGRAEDSDATVQALMETAGQAILACDNEGRIVLANVTAEKMFGYDRAALMNRPLASLIAERFRREYERHRHAWFTESHHLPVGSIVELMAQRRDGFEFFVEMTLSRIVTREATLGVAFVTDISKRKEGERVLDEYREQLRSLSGALLTAQETANRELARELHDVYSQELAALSMEISSLQLDDLALKQSLAEIGDKIGQLANSIHRTSRQLHPAILDELGLEPAVREECQKFSGQSRISVKFRVKRMPASLPAEVPLTLYRVLQECLRNIRAHADPSEVRVELAGIRGGVRLRVEDIGDGFDLVEARRKGGLGLVSMEERVRLVNGKLTIETRRGKGTTVEVFVPGARASR